MDVFSICIIIYLALLLPSYLFATSFRSKTSNLPPTVFPTLPIIGHLYLLKSPLYRTFAKISTKYGPIILLQLGFRRVLLVSSPSAVEECFTKNDLVFANRPKMVYGKIMGNNYTSMSWASYSDHWRNLRRIASTELLSLHRLNKLHDIRMDEGRLLIHKLLLTNSSPVNMKSVFYELTLNVMMRMISGKRYFGGNSSTPDLEEEGKQFKKILDEAFLSSSASNIADYLPSLSWLGLKGLEKKLIALKEKRDVFLQGLINQLKQVKSDEVENKENTMIEVLLSLQRSDPEYYNDEMIMTYVMVLLSAGIETSSTTMGLSLLLNNPQVIQKAQNEIDLHVGKYRLIEESDIVDLPYLRCILNETLRLYPAGPLLIPHESSEDCIVGGYHIPRGTMLLVNQWAMNHDPELWADDPERFNLERFEGLEESRDYGFKLISFGSGRRRCPGEGLALRVVGLTLGLLIQCFEWERVSEDLVDMTEGHGLTMPKAKPLIAKCKPRLVMQNLLSQL